MERVPKGGEMGKAIWVNRCYDCPHIRWDTSTLSITFCSEVDPHPIDIPDENAIPEWCPLEDAPEELGDAISEGNEFPKGASE